MDRAEILIKNESTTKIIDRLWRVGSALAGHGGGYFVDDFELDEDFDGDGKSLSAQSSSSEHSRFDVFVQLEIVHKVTAAVTKESNASAPNTVNNFLRKFIF